MKIKRFVGKNNKEAMYKLKKQLGSDAIILHTRKIKQSGILGFLKKPLVEIVAAIDDNVKKPKVERAYKKEFNRELSKAFNSKLNNNTNIIGSNNKYPRKKENSGNENTTNDDIKKLKETVEDFISSIKNKEVLTLPEPLSYYRKKMLENGVQLEIAEQILSQIGNDIDVNSKDEDTISNIVRYSIKNYLGDPYKPTDGQGQKIIFFIGPTGVGKTTTLAKIAAHYVLEKQKEVGLVTADTYRIAAVEQLKTYSKILNIPIKIIYKMQEFDNVLSNFIDKDVVLVDTAGRSHNNKEQMEEIEGLLNSGVNKEIYLVLSAATSTDTIKEIIEKYDFIDDYKIIFTKTDEVANLGVILNTRAYTNKRLSYITTGQNVPEDIEIINLDNLINKLIGVNNNE